MAEEVINQNSILDSIKKLVGIGPGYGAFDVDLILHINGELATLCQLGVGPSAGFEITGSTETWTSFIGTDPRLNLVKQYVALRVRLSFDPPASSIIKQAISEKIAELEYRIFIQTDPYPYVPANGREEESNG